MSRGSRLPELEIPPGWSSARLFGEAALSLYGAVGQIVTPFAGAMLYWREIHGKEDGARRGERLGSTSHVRPSGPLVWLHAASVGETVAALPLSERLTERGAAVLLTTGTVTAAQVAGQRLPAGAIHQFVPIDTPAAVNRFLDRWRPELALFAESELWPTTLNMLHRRAVPTIIVNARMSERTFRLWRTFTPLARTILGKVELFLAQSLEDAHRLRELGARRVLACGNLKFDVPPPPADDAAVAELRQDMGARSVLLAASTHPGEEHVVIAAHQELARTGRRLLTIMAPRHPERGRALAAEVAAAGLAVRRRSAGEKIARDTDVYIVDTVGEMGLWYRLADFAFLGGSLIPHGGQNPIEAAKLLVPILRGPHVSNFRDVYGALAEAGAVLIVRDGASLAAAVGLLVEERHERERLAREAYACVERSTGALERTLEALEPYLAALRRAP